MHEIEKPGLKLIIFNLFTNMSRTIKVIYTSVCKRNKYMRAFNQFIQGVFKLRNLQFNNTVILLILINHINIYVQTSKITLCFF